jgi:PII-like signaling protein
MLQAHIYINKDELKEEGPLHQFIMQFLIERGLSGATSFVGYTGFGRHHRLKQPTQQFSFDETPMLIVFIDEDLKVKEAITELRKQYTGGLIITHPVEQW